MQHLLLFQDKLQHDEGAAAGGNFDLACMGFLLIAGIVLKKRKAKKETVSEKA